MNCLKTTLAAVVLAGSLGCGNLPDDEGEPTTLATVRGTIVDSSGSMASSLRGGN